MTIAGSWRSSPTWSPAKRPIEPSVTGAVEDFQPYVWKMLHTLAGAGSEVVSYNLR